MRPVVGSAGPAGEMTSSLVSSARLMTSNAAQLGPAGAAAAPTAAATPDKQTATKSGAAAAPANPASSERKRCKPRVAPEDLMYDPDGYYLRAASVCVRDATEREVLLVSSPARGPDCWLVPGGKVQAGETGPAAAAREALEEAGAAGAVGRLLGTFDNAERRHRTRVYVLTVAQLLDRYEEADIRRRSWFPVEEAKARLTGHHLVHRSYVEALRQGRPGGDVDDDDKAVTNDAAVKNIEGANK